MGIMATLTTVSSQTAKEVDEAYLSDAYMRQLTYYHWFK